MRILILFISMFITVFFSYGQSIEQTTKNIDGKVLKINQYKNYKTDSLIDLQFLDERFVNQQGQGFGRLVGYFKNDSIYKITEVYGLKLMNDIATTEYYFWHSKLIYISEKEVYNPNISMDSTGTVDRRIPGADFDASYYFENDKIINTISKGEAILLPNEKYFDSQSKEGQLLETAKKNIGLLKKL